MAEERAQRHLAAILAADVVGYSRLMEQDEADTFARLRAHRKELFEPEIERHQGRVFKLMGDGLLAEFGSVVDAVECAVALQRGMAARNNGVPAEQRIEVRIGVNLGDVIVEGEDRHGEGVNIAARLQQLAEPGGIRVSGKVAQEVEKKLAFGFESMGEQHMKNIAEPVHVYRVLVDGTAAHAPRRRLARRISRPRAMAAAFIGLVAVGVAVNWDRIRDWIDVTPPPVPGPKIAVLPFTSEGGDPCNAAFSAGLAEDISAALARFSDVSVIGGDSTVRSTGENVDVREVGYKLEGSVRCSADGLRVTARLRNAANDKMAPSVIQDVTLSEANDLKAREELAGLVAGGIASPTTQLWKWERENTEARLKSNQTDLLQAYYCVRLSYDYYNTFSAEDHKVARDCLVDAVDRVPAYALAWARLGTMYFDEDRYGINPRPGRNSLKDAKDAAQKAIELDPRAADGYHILALLYYYTEKGFDSFQKTANKAIDKNPYNGWIVGELGIWTYYSGEWELGKALIERVRRIYTDDPRWLDFPGVLDHYRKREYGEAKAAALALGPRQVAGVQEVLAAAYGQLGELENAKRTIDEILEIHPEVADNPRAPFLARKMPTELIEALMDGLRKAGLEVAPPG